MGTIGELEQGFEQHTTIKWTINNFLSLPREVDEEVESPAFDFAGERWRIIMWPNGCIEDESEGYIDIWLQRLASGPTITVEHSFGLITSNNDVDKEQHFTGDYNEEFSSNGWIRFLERSELLSDISELAPSGHLTWVIKLETPESSDAANQRGTKRKYEETQTQEEKNLESVCRAYKKVLLDGSNHDVILKVRDREFRAHRDILSARSKVFYSMLNTDMIEKKSEVIKIPDCDPESMELFLMHVYCGRVEGLEQSNVFGLYYMADKYELMSLIDECRNFIKSSLSPSNICEIIQLAIKHSDASLLQFAREYFSCHVLEILCTDEWKYFLKTNLTVANELIIMSHENKK